MAPPSFWVHFIDTALSNATGTFSFSYADPDQKWLIRNHLLSLLRHQPSFSLSSHTFFHNDGSAVNLLTASGSLRVSPAAPPVPITIWVHQNYPQTAPLVFVAPPPSDPPIAIHHNHPFVDLSGAVTCPYLNTWHHKYNLSGLVQNLVNIFSVDHPFYFPPGPSFAHPSLASKMEALDRLAGSLHYDVVVVRAVNEDEIEKLAKLQATMVERVNMGSGLVSGLERERAGLKRRVTELTEQADVLANWTRVNSDLIASLTGKNGNDHDVLAADEEEDAFEAAEEESRVAVECLAADRGIEDLIYAMDKAVEEGVLSFELYMKQVRGLAREQFLHRAMLVKLNDLFAE